MRIVAIVVVGLAALAVAACGSGSTDEAADTTPSPTSVPAVENTPVAAVPTAATTSQAKESAQPTAAPQPAAVMIETAPCTPGASLEEQKATLAAAANAQFQGNTREDLPRLPYGADVRDHRQGGLWVVVEFRGDELETIADRKAALDRQMIEAYAAIFGAGCDDLKWVDLSGLQRAIVKVGMMGDPASPQVPVFKTRMTAEEAEEVDWDNRHSLDFSDIWKELLLNPRWRDELKETGGN